MNAFDTLTAHDLACARQLYARGSEGTLLLRLDERSGGPQTAVAAVAEHRPVEGEQFRFSIGKEPVPRRLPAGVYTVTITAVGFEPFRSSVEIAPGQVAEFAARLEKSERHAPSFKELVARYRLPFDERNQPSVQVPEGTTLVLDTTTREFARHRHVIEVNSTALAKEVIGNADHHWPGDAPRFGHRVRSEPRPEDKDGSTLAARAALREYIYGNSRSVAKWKEVLDQILAKDSIDVSLFVLPDIDVGKGSTLHLHGAGLLCNRLRVHIFGKVLVTGSGPTRIEMNTYSLYGVRFEKWPSLQALPLVE